MGALDKPHNFIYQSEEKRNYRMTEECLFIIDCNDQTTKESYHKKNFQCYTKISLAGFIGEAT